MKYRWTRHLFVAGAIAGLASPLAAIGNGVSAQEKEQEVEVEAVVDDVIVFYQDEDKVAEKDGNKEEVKTKRIRWNVKADDIKKEEGQPQARYRVLYFDDAGRAKELEGATKEGVIVVQHDGKVLKVKRDEDLKIKPQRFEIKIDQDQLKQKLKADIEKEIEVELKPLQEDIKIFRKAVVGEGDKKGEIRIRIERDGQVEEEVIELDGGKININQIEELDRIMKVVPKRMLQLDGVHEVDGNRILIHRAHDEEEHDGHHDEAHSHDSEHSPKAEGHAKAARDVIIKAMQDKDSGPVQLQVIRLGDEQPSVIQLKGRAEDVKQAQRIIQRIELAQPAEIKQKVEIKKAKVEELKVEKLKQVIASLKKQIEALEAQLDALENDGR